MIFLKRKWIKQKDPSENLSATVANLFRFLKIPATQTNIRKTLKSHPDFPSILSIAESLPEWGVQTEAVKGTISDISKADFPGIAHMKSNEFVVLEEIKDGQVRILNPANGPRIYSLDSFGEIWSGVILRVIPEKTSGEKDYSFNRKKEVFSISISLT